MAKSDLPTGAYEVKHNKDTAFSIEFVGESESLILYSGLGEELTNEFLTKLPFSNFTLIKVGLAPR